jgi:sugar/nucleoside kinase (ribokinase family)
MPKLDVSIAGELNLDLILYGLPQNMPMERELLASAFSVTLGSSSAILAHNLAALGTKVGFITRVGDDDFGRIAIDRLSTSGVDLSRVVPDKLSGSGVTVILPHDRERHILTYPGTIFELRFEDLDLEYLSSARHFHMSSLFLHRAMADRIPDLFRLMKSKGLSTSLDTNDDPDNCWSRPLRETLPYVDVLLPNEREVGKIAGTDDLEEAISRLCKMGMTLIVKLGAKGAVAAKGDRRITLRSNTVEVVDTVGAGDSFNAGFLHQFVRGANLETCLEYGNLAGAFSTTASGGTEAFRNPGKIEQFIAAHVARSS